MAKKGSDESLPELDRQLLRLLNERVRMAAGRRGDKPEAAGGRKDLDRWLKDNPGPLEAGTLAAIYRELNGAALSLRSPLQVAYLGPEATFTHQAARRHFGAAARYIPCETVAEVFSEAVKGRVDRGVVPIENSIEGAVTYTMDQLMDASAQIVAEVTMPIAQHLMAGIPLERIRRVYSHPSVFGQCRMWLQRNLPGVECVSASSTARAVVQAAEDDGGGAIAATLAAEMYGLRILERDIQDEGGNTTRFLVLGGERPAPSGHDKTSLLFAVKHQVGALYGALQAFRDFGINMMRIESRPSRTGRWEYCFFVDIEGHVDRQPLPDALAELERHCTQLSVLGSYPRAREDLEGSRPRTVTEEES